jgi:hypothetical protein
MSNTLIILAGGKQTRWPDKTNKMLSPINGQPLIYRTYSLLQDVGFQKPIVYSKFPEVIGANESYYPEKDKETIVEAIAASSCLWNDGMITILLGDVVFSRNVLALLSRSLLNDSYPIQLIGRLGHNPFTGKPWPEIYGLRFLGSASEKILKSIDEVLNGKYERKKIWELYRALIGVPQIEKPDSEYLFHPPRNKIFALVNDWTDDIDTPEEYHNMTRLLDYLKQRPQYLSPGILKKAI